MSRPTYMQIDRAALRNNFARVRALVPGKSIIAMVKANAYGHGIVQIVKDLDKADALGVASLEEACKLREGGITQPIVLLEGLFFSDEVAEAARQNVTLIVHHLPQVEMLEKARVQHVFSVWLKIDTGMHRLGIQPTQLDHIYQRLLALPIVKKPIGLMTHFAEADLMNSAATQRQIQLFKQVTAHLPGPRSLANSAGILGWEEAYGDWVRPGLMLYGASPFADKTGQDHGLQPVMTLWSRLIAISAVKQGEKVGYNGTWTASQDTLIGVVGAGYGDGYPQYAKNGTPILVNGKECALVGRVSMDMLTVDLTNQPHATIGDPVILWGSGLPVERVARNNNTSAYEMLTRMTPRPKVEVKE